MTQIERDPYEPDHSLASEFKWLFIHLFIHSLIQQTSTEDHALSHINSILNPKSSYYPSSHKWETEVWKEEVISPDACPCSEFRIETGKNTGVQREKQ